MNPIDIHTHRLSSEDGIQILNIFAQDIPNDEPEYLFSSGLHPWHIGKVNPDDCFRAIEQATEFKNMLAIGECGLDRSISTNFALQEMYFQEQIRIAARYHKPLIIHCVRAYSDVIHLKRKTRSGVPWILHGYNSNLDTTLNLIKHGFYFSIGEQLLKNESRHPIFQTIPIERLFLETDDREISIRKIYSLAAPILKIEEKMLVETIFSNFTTLFGNEKIKNIG